MCLASHPVQPPALARPPLHSSDVALGWPGSCLLVFSGMHWGSSEWGGDVGTSICRTMGLFACHYGAAVGWTCSSHGAHEFGPSSFAFLAQQGFRRYRTGPDNGGHRAVLRYLAHKGISTDEAHNRTQSHCRES